MVDLVMFVKFDVSGAIGTLLLLKRVIFLIWKSLMLFLKSINFSNDHSSHYQDEAADVDAEESDDVILCFFDYYLTG